MESMQFKNHNKKQLAEIIYVTSTINIWRTVSH